MARLQVKGTFNKRVFIAGDYRHGSVLTTIKEAVKLAKMEPILLRDLGIKPGTESDSAEEVLKQCKYVILEVSSETAGLAMEMQIIKQILAVAEIVPLCLWDSATSSEPKVGPMVTSHSVFKIRIKRYSGWRELEEIVYEFLKKRTPGK